MDRKDIVPGALVRIYDSVGYIEDVYISPTTGNFVIFFKLVKNVYKYQDGDMIPFPPHHLDRIQPATLEELVAEIASYKGMVNDRMQKFFGELISTEAATPYGPEDFPKNSPGPLPPFVKFDGTAR